MTTIEEAPSMPRMMSETHLDRIYGDAYANAWDLPGDEVKAHHAGLHAIESAARKETLEEAARLIESQLTGNHKSGPDLIRKALILRVRELRSTND